MTLILGIETSCDETAASVVEDGRRVRSNVVWSQHELHSRYSGVVPELASRAHLERIAPVITQALEDAGVAIDVIDAVAVGNRPGLVGSLLVGVSAAKALAWALGKPLLGVDHIRAHLYAPHLRLPPAEATPELAYPALGLVVSGGHTSLYEVASPLEMTLLGRTIDDAVGEAYDKAAVILGVGYPGGPLLDKLAREAQARLPAGTKPDPALELPRSLLGPDSLDFSFSGLKTALLYKVRGTPTGRGAGASFERSAADLGPQRQGDLAASFQRAAVETLIIKLGRALDLLASRGRPSRSLLIGGGVSANSLLRTRVAELGAERRLAVGVPPMTFCLDNAAMIAGLAHHAFAAGRFDGLDLPVLATSSV
ncbi:MAG: tRNA (adenosine(37)-N6)-threonylcarbamoyltransferase complex transferase subunit TsaD [Planctomycetota bacterium]|nr:tRNA (adenosine(37)-N6)-threonylcarbamoyltransferase complex transferase subunit TsaD [Planctomycetota bacterium]